MFFESLHSMIPTKIYKCVLRNVLLVVFSVGSYSHLKNKVVSGLCAVKTKLRPCFFHSN